MHAYTRGSQSLVHNDAHLLCKCRQVPDIIQYQTFEWEGSQKNGLSPTYLLKIAAHVAPASLLFLVGDKLQFCVLVSSPLFACITLQCSLVPRPWGEEEEKEPGNEASYFASSNIKVVMSPTCLHLHSPSHWSSLLCPTGGCKPSVADTEGCSPSHILHRDRRTWSQGATGSCSTELHTNWTVWQSVSEV